MNRCATCIHWVPYRTKFPGNHYTDKVNGGGLCESPKLSEEHTDDQYATDALVYPYNEGGYFWTGPEFGCVHHAPVADGVL